MKLRNKKTGEVATLTLSSNGEDLIIMGNDMLAHITKLSELKDYEDYEEPKVYYYFIDDDGFISIDQQLSPMVNMRKSFGNYFETREEAEKAMEKLRAWKRLTDKGFKFDNFVRDAIYFNLDEEQIQNKSVLKDLDLLFGGEE